MNVEWIKVGMSVFVDKKGSPYFGQEGRVLSIFSDYGAGSAAINIRLELDDGVVIGGFTADEICA